MRRALESFSGGDNLALKYQRYVPEEALRGDHEKKRQFLPGLADFKPHCCYNDAFERYKAALNSLQNTVVFEMQCASPLAIGTGAKSVLEVGLSFQVPYGLPYLPGSSLKGAMRRAAADALNITDELTEDKDAKRSGYSPEKKLSEWGVNSEDAKIRLWAEIFGTVEAAGAFEVFDAWLVPTSKPMMLDTVTVHFGEYYKSKGKKPPRDGDAPNPIAMLAVRPKTKFLFAVQACDQASAESTAEILKGVLKKYGAGAKTNAGYGYFREPTAHAEDPVEPSRQAPKPPVAGELVKKLFSEGEWNIRVPRENGQVRCTGVPAEGAAQGKKVFVQKVEPMVYKFVRFVDQ
jgi:CRISPR-associated protein Cmr6